jgi:hypothetical protein
MRAASFHHTRPCRGRPGLQALTPLCSVRCRHPDTSLHHDRICANPDERHETHGEESMEIRGVMPPSGSPQRSCPGLDTSV